MSNNNRPLVLDGLFKDIGENSIASQRTITIIKKLVSGNYFKDLLYHAPYNIIDRTYMPELREAIPNKTATFIVTVLEHKAPFKRGGVYRVITSTEDEELLELLFFNRKPEWIKSLIVGEKRIVSGRLEKYNSKNVMPHPDIIAYPQKINQVAKIYPVYSLSNGISAYALERHMKNALEVVPKLDEWIEPSLIKKMSWDSWDTAIRKLHNPQNTEDLLSTASYRMRLAYDELLANQVTLSIARNIENYNTNSKGKRTLKKKPFSADSLTTKVMDSLPFSLTKGQKEALDDIYKDMSLKTRMSRLIQGDVGCGKTIIAILSMVSVIENGYQAVLMAPTEILAEQHYNNIFNMLYRFNVNVVFLSSKITGKKRQETLKFINMGVAHLVIGTHSLIQDDVIFHKLGLAIIDEQHRFGVEQRLKLNKKGDRVDNLVMTATPIPRTLLLTEYGDLDVSIIKDKPLGRKDIDTRIISNKKIDEIIVHLKKILSSKKKVYWICPLVNENEKLALQDVVSRYDILKESLGEQVGIIHGKLKAKDKEQIMSNFQRGGLNLLVATTVIEVGVDIKEANIMIIEHAERFGLAQLHQLRGRVGRDSEEATCLLIYSNPLSAVAKERLKVMKQTNDGFKISQKDLELRGSGEIMGLKQSGLENFKIAELQYHKELLEISHKDAKLLLHQDPHLKSKRGLAVRNLLYLFEKNNGIRYFFSG